MLQLAPRPRGGWAREALRQFQTVSYGRDLQENGLKELPSSLGELQVIKVL